MDSNRPLHRTYIHTHIHTYIHTYIHTIRERMDSNRPLHQMKGKTDTGVRLTSEQARVKRQQDAEVEYVCMYVCMYAHVSA